MDKRERGTLCVAVLCYPDKGVTTPVVQGQIFKIISSICSEYLEGKGMGLCLVEYLRLFGLFFFLF